MIGNVIKKARIKKNMTQQEIANKADVSRAYYALSLIHI